MDSDDDWIFVSLDLDEFIEPNGIQKIKNLWKPEYDMMYMKGYDSQENLTYEVYSKIHSNDPSIKWVRFVHEIVKKGNLNINDCNICHPGIDIVCYNHMTDRTKNHDYYTLLKTAIKHEPFDVRNNLYLAMEAYEHNEYENYYK